MKRFAPVLFLAASACGAAAPGLRMLIGLLAVLGMVACAPEQPLDSGGVAAGTDQPDLIVVCVDTLRADHTSLYGYFRDTTPHLRSLRSKGLFLSNHFANASWTKPSVASIITGVHPSAHGSRLGKWKIGREASPVEILSDKLETLAERMKSAGYRTIASTTNYTMNPRFGYAQGYDEYRFVEKATELDRVNQSDRESIEFLRQHLGESDQPVFAWVHLMSVHQKASPEEFKRFESTTHSDVDLSGEITFVRNLGSIEALVDAYDNAILYVDSLIGELMEELQAADRRPVVIITSDHGEELYDRQAYGHSHTLYNELLKVPGLLLGPGIPCAEITGITDSLDLFPTLITLAGAGSADSLPGRSLLSRTGVTAGKAESFAEQHAATFMKRVSIIRDGRKLILNRVDDGRELPEFYLNGLEVETEAPITRLGREQLDEYLSRIEAHEAASRRRFEATVEQLEVKIMGPEDLEHLRALGYVE